MTTESVPPRLTLREHKAVWMLSQGSSLDEVAAELKIQNHGASQVLLRARNKFGCANRYSLLATLILEGHVGKHLDCGRSAAAYQRHISAQEAACPACIRFHRHRASLAENPPPPGSITLTPRQNEVLQVIASGVDSVSEIGEKMGLHRKNVASLLSEIYRVLNIPHRDNWDRRRIALYVARQRGFVPMPDGTYRTSSGPLSIPPQMRLSPAQCDLLRACEDGSSLAVVGQRCGLSRESTAARLSEIYRRLGVPRSLNGAPADRRTRRREAIRRAREYGLLD